MGELLDRGLQKDILTRLAADYPRATEVSEAFHELPGNVAMVNLAYLEEHGLVKNIWIPAGDDDEYPADAKITARGLDFLAGDGGLSAILGTVTIKLHDETLQKLLIEKIRDADGDDGFKKELIEKVKGMPAEAAGEVAKRLVTFGLDNVPNAVIALGKLLFGV